MKWAKLIMLVLGVKLFDAAVTYVDCGIFSDVESNSYLLFLVGVTGSWAIVFPYLLGFGVISLVFFKMAASGKNVLVKSFCFSIGLSLAGIAILGPLSHFALFYDGFVLYSVVFVVFVLHLEVLKKYAKGVLS